MAANSVIVWHRTNGFIDMDPNYATNPEYPYGKPKAWMKTKNTTTGNIYNSTGNPEQKFNGITNGYFEPTEGQKQHYAEKEPRPSTPRINTGTGTHYGNAGRKTKCPTGSSCAVMGGRRTRRAKSRRTKSRRVRRS